MSAQAPPGWYSPRDNDVIHRSTMGMVAVVAKAGGAWEWSVHERNATDPIAVGSRPRRYQAAEVASAVMAAIGAQK